MLSPIDAPYDFDQLYLAGRWRHGGSASPLTVRDPYNGQVLAQLVSAGADDVDEAFREADRAQRSWRRVLPGERARIIRRAAEILEARREETVSWLVREAGSTRLKATMEVDAVLAMLLDAATLPHRAEGRIIPGDIEGKENRLYRKPIGVVGLITPWNFPLHLTSRTLAPALALGNAVVVKPAEETPITGGLLLAKIFEEAGLPPGVISVLAGPSRVIGDPFLLHPVPSVVSFTGSTPVGRHVAHCAATGPRIKSVMLELGGNNPFVILDDADIDLAVRAAVAGKFIHQGQLCITTNRIIVHSSIQDEFVERYVDRVGALKTGDPNDPDTVIGPIVSQRHFAGLVKIIEAARAEGAHQALGGRTTGQVLPPHVFTSVTEDMAIGRDEIFGPIVPIISVSDDEEALRVANDTEYGLSSAVFTSDAERGLAFAHRIEAGMTHINDMPVVDLANMPFGGEKNSGLGRFGGDALIDELTRRHWISVQHQPRRYPF
ncbi:aldehyde dehydrogenase family protein [Streptomyces iranensis]|uniref:Salicylaldehyde dehydrogenase n=1 Tax=Streptomyces iranensis TaxID=576784 RepID=A0A060ZZX8_9ACTN|nr:aldehyde dehydrogenase family protein [Streptomyces iranensis]MBP2066173.1 aldehyde dehydrogenase (NAD+) [Streptomyces iranensis]CDR13124.1 aldehyde dehydrogenase [Streptomyces iranensis]